LEAENLYLTDLLAIKKVNQPDMVSVQLNGEFVKRVDYSKTIVSENTEIDFLYFMGGGSGISLRSGRA
jgi:sulfur carrier protein